MLLQKSEHKENSKDWWNERYSKKGADHYLYSKEPSKFLLEQLNLFPKNAKILEIAAGEGRNAVALSAQGFQVTAIEFAPVALERAKKLANDSHQNAIEFRSGDLDFFIPDLMTFDAIVSIDFKPPLSLLKNLSRGLKQNGILVMEAYLLESAKAYEGVETFECYKPNELLQHLAPSGIGSYRILHYSELQGSKSGEKAYLVAKKSQMF